MNLRDPREEEINKESKGALSIVRSNWYHFALFSLFPRFSLNDCKTFLFLCAYLVEAFSVG